MYDFDQLHLGYWYVFRTDTNRTVKAFRILWPRWRAKRYTNKMNSQ